MLYQVAQVGKELKMNNYNNNNNNNLSTNIHLVRDRGKQLLSLNEQVVAATLLILNPVTQSSKSITKL